MQHLLRVVSPESPLARAARLVVLASVGNRSNRPALVKRSENEYGDLLSLYHKSLSSGGPVSVEDLYTAVLLGIFEVRPPQLWHENQKTVCLLTYHR